MKDVVTGGGAGLRVEIVPGLWRGRLPKLNCATPNPQVADSGCFLVVSMPCLIDRRAVRLIAKNRFIGEYPRPKAGEKKRGRFGAGDGNAGF
jgi:hypothetical protein